MAYLGRRGQVAALSSADIPDNSITAAKIVDSTIAAGDLAANSVDSSELVDGSVDLSHMSANSVDSDQYVDGSIDLVHMSANSVDSDQYVDASIDTAHLASNIAISTSGAITTTGAFTSVGITDGAVGATAITIDSSENVGIGTSPTSLLDLLVTSSDECDVFLRTYSTTDTNSSRIVFRKSSSNTANTHAITADGESLGRISFQGATNASAVGEAALIEVKGQGTAEAYVGAEMKFLLADENTAAREIMSLKKNYEINAYSSYMIGKGHYYKKGTLDATGDTAARTVTMSSVLNTGFLMAWMQGDLANNCCYAFTGGQQMVGDARLHQIFSNSVTFSVTGSWNALISATSGTWYYSVIKTS